MANAVRMATESAERRQAEEQTGHPGLRAEGIFGVDINGVITFVNPPRAGCSVRARRDDRADLAQPDPPPSRGRQRVPERSVPMMAAYRDGKPSRVDDECLWRQNGSALPAEYGATPILKEGTIVGALSASATHRAQAQPARAGRQRAQIRRILDTSTEGFC